jgi:hypothetical protein
VDSRFPAAAMNDTDCGDKQRIAPLQGAWTEREIRLNALVLGCIAQRVHELRKLVGAECAVLSHARTQIQPEWLTYLMETISTRR